MKPLLALLLAVLPLASCSDSEAAVDKAPISIVDFDELQVALAEYEGRPMLLNFWAIWCGPCVAELPELLEVGEEFADRNAIVVGVSDDLMVAGAPENEEMLARMRKFLDGKGWDFPVLIFDGADHERLNEHYGLPGGIPQTLAINAAGEIVDRQEGRAEHERFVEMMRAAVGE